MKVRTLTLSVLLSMLPLRGLLQAQITGVTAGTDLTGGGTQGNVTLNLDTTKVPRLAAANTFTANQSVKGNVTATGTVAGSEFLLGSNLFGVGSFANGNAFLGFSGNTSTSGTNNTGTGYKAMPSNTSGGGNTAIGSFAMYSNQTGEVNSAVGAYAMYSNVRVAKTQLWANKHSFQTRLGPTIRLRVMRPSPTTLTGGSNVAFGEYALFR